MRLDLFALVSMTPAYTPYAIARDRFQTEYFSVHTNCRLEPSGSTSRKSWRTRCASVCVDVYTHAHAAKHRTSHILAEVLQANGTVIPYNFAFYLKTDAHVFKARTDCSEVGSG